MKINLETLANGLQSIRKLAQLDLGNPKTNFKFMGVVASVETEVKKYAELHNKIVEKYRDKSISEEIRIPLENIEAFNKEAQEASVIEVELDWDIIDCSIDGLKGFTANDMKCLNGTFINIKAE